MFYKTCLGITIALITFSLIASYSSANAVIVRQQNFVDNRARQYSRTTYFVPVPYGYSSTGGGSGGSSRSSYGGFNGGGPGTGK